MKTHTHCSSLPPACRGAINGASDDGIHFLRVCHSLKSAHRNTGIIV